MIMKRPHFLGDVTECKNAEFLIFFIFLFILLLPNPVFSKFAKKLTWLPYLNHMIQMDEVGLSKVGALAALRHCRQNIVSTINIVFFFFSSSSCAWVTFIPEGDVLGS